MVRSQSHSASSTNSQAVEPKPPAGSGGNDSKGSESTCQGDSKTDEEDMAGPGGEVPRDAEGQDGKSSDVESSNDGVINNDNVNIGNLELSLLMHEHQRWESQKCTNNTSKRGKNAYNTLTHDNLISKSHV